MSKPSARELLNDINLGGYREAEAELTDRVEKVLALHEWWPGNPDGATREEREPQCLHCGRQWPCGTVRILNGEEEP